MEKKYRDIFSLNRAAGELNIPVGFLKMTKEGIILINYPMIMLGNPFQKLRPQDIKNIEHLVGDLKEDIHFIIDPATPFKDKKNRLFGINHNMVSAFLNMVDLKHYFPQLEIYMPEGMIDIKPGISFPYSKELENGLLFFGKKYIPPALDDLADQVGINFMIKPLHSKNIYTHTIMHNIRS